ncbi:LAGLIDADG family homing endonuclease [Candidatus Gottesmanbacteria bacterium]|nr:LAGLIDADG family homing endonuclease [Candidatus Gottesmanbacteria bacterium]
MNISDNALSAGNQQERLPKDSENLHYYLAGFVDGEGSFSITIHRHSTRFGWVIDPLFQVYQHKDNAYILYIFKKTFNCGYVSEKGGNPSCYVYCVDKIQQLKDIVIPFFEKYPLVGEKYNNFSLFRNVVHKLANREHFTKEGFTEITKLCFQMNRNGKYRKNSVDTILRSLKNPQRLYAKP